MTQRICKPSPVLALIVGGLISAGAVNATSELHVVDGDTIDWGWRLTLERARYRLAGFDAPETRGAKCAGERAIGEEAPNACARS
jgi:endonuclease YncB( thermonuclease family)